MSNQIDRMGEYTLHRDEQGEWAVEGPNPDVTLWVDENRQGEGLVVKVAWMVSGGALPDHAADFGSELINASQAAKYFTDVMNLPEYNEQD